jgi:hypothetical protein
MKIQHIDEHYFPPVWWKRKQAERLLWKEYTAWCAQHLRPGELISIGYFVKVLDCGKNDMARTWG